MYYAAESDSSDLSAEQSRQGPLLFVLIVLRTAAIGLGYRILEQLETLPGSLLPNETIVYLVFLPLLTIAMDQSSTIKRRVTGRRVEQWSDIIQTVSFTYFFVRPLATLVRSEIDPTGGRKPLALCLIVASAWMKISKVPCKYQIVIPLHELTIHSIREGFGRTFVVCIRILSLPDSTPGR